MSLPDQEEQKNWYEQLKSKFTTADAVWLAGTGLIAALNPKGIKGQAKVIKDDLELSKKMGANLVTNANKVISQETLPKMEEVENEKKELLEFINADLQGFGEGASPVRNPFIMALIQSGPAYWRAFREKLKKHNEWRTKTTASGGGGMQSLTAAEIESAFGDGTSILERYKDAPDDALSIDQWSDYIDKRYKDWEEYIDKSGASTSAEAGVFAEMYAPTVGAMSERDRLLAMLPGRNVGNEYFSMDDLFAISQSATDFGIPSDELIPVEGGYDFGRTTPTPFFSKVDNVYRNKVNIMLGDMVQPNSPLNNAIKSVSYDATGIPPNTNPFMGVFSMMKSEGPGDWWNQPGKVPWNGSIEDIERQINILQEAGAEDTAYYQVLNRAKEVANMSVILPLVYSQTYANAIAAKNSTKIRDRRGADDESNVVATNLNAFISKNELENIYEGIRNKLVYQLSDYKNDNSDEKKRTARSIMLDIVSELDQPFLNPETLARFLKGMGVRKLSGGGYSYSGLQADDTFRFFSKIDSNNQVTLFEMTLAELVQNDMLERFF